MSQSRPFRLFLFLVFNVICAFQFVIGQVTVFSDDFSSNTNNAWTTSGQIGSSAWTVYRAGDDWGARRDANANQLELSNDISGTANLLGYALVTTPTTSFGTPFNPILNVGNVVTWSFNFRQTQADPGGFNSGDYGIGFILAGQSATTNTTGSGYAIVLGQSGTTDPIRLVSYSNGIGANMNLTNVIVSSTSGLSDFGNQFISVRVSYRPCINQWDLSIRNDGPSEFENPLAGTLVFQSTGVDALYTGIPLNMMAAYWQGNIAADRTAYFDNISVKTSVCQQPSTMRWVLLNEFSTNGACISTSDCGANMICYGLEYTPLYTGVMSSYTSIFFMDCNAGVNPIVTNSTCVMSDMSGFLDFCVVADSISMFCSANSGNIRIGSGVSLIIHQACFTVPTNGNLNITKDITFQGNPITVGVDSAGAGGSEIDVVNNYIPLSINGAIECALLPLRWLEFSASNHGELQSLLSWSTADEINNSHFEIQRSSAVDGQFQTIGKVNAMSAGSGLNQYQFIDSHAVRGTNYYRLRQIDYDGRSDLSPIRKVTFLNSNTLQIKVWPNPVRDRLTVSIWNAEENGNFYIMDMTGKIILEEEFEKGVTDREVVMDTLATGVYSLIVKSSMDSHIEKIIIVD
ncbi:MAG: T9SS type A sorting domain-containing protein [Bacteroidota bacterium]|nr:T9SS type A sorting domain-containing protein [Bacteroidota bacterium]